ncbi:hypothetical protein HDU85_000279 [Gaertneriomyces sp. JEL0708]|nr:hypothetical protein HDU85_000279 [Gaertneriomyces sp. JEL0708]
MSTTLRRAPHSLPPIHKRTLSCDGKRLNVSCGNDRQVTSSRHSSSSTEVQSGSSAAVSLSICKKCQEMLLSTFDHCLGKDSEPFQLESVYLIDETQDAQSLTEPPHFRVVLDPTKPRIEQKSDVAQKIDGQRWAFHRQLAHARAEDPANKRHAYQGPRGVGIESAYLFSGTVYRKNLEANQKEIMNLREQLYDRMVAEKSEQEDVEKLRAALKKAVNYYVYAEEWQAAESARLQADVRALKVQVSALMAFIISSEGEKRKLCEEIGALHSVVTQKDERIADTEGIVEEMQDKLHESFKEFLQMNETMTKLRLEAKQGTDATHDRNEVLQKNLDKVAREYEATAKELTLSHNRTRELELELQELVSQFNATGEAKRSSEEQNIRLAAELDKAVNETRGLQHAYEISNMQNLQLEQELRDMGRIYEDSKYELTNRVTDLETRLSAIIEERDKLTENVTQYKAENDQLTRALQEMTKARDLIETNVRTSTQKFEKEAKQREIRIDELSTLRAEDAKAIAALQQHKDQLVFQVTDLQIALDRETANVNMLNFEMVQVRRQADEKNVLLAEQIEKLNQAKNTLAADKRQVTEKFKATRAELMQREQELEDVTREFSMYKAQAESIDVSLRQSLDEARKEQENLLVLNKELQQRHASTVSANHEMIERQQELEERQQKIEAMEAQTRAENIEMRLKNESMHTQLEEVFMEKHDIKTHLESVLVKVDELTAVIDNTEEEHVRVIEEKDSQIAKLSKESYTANEEVTRLDSLSKRLQKLVDKLDADLAATKKALATESANRESVEAALHDVRQSLQSERKVRLEFERMHAKLDRRDVEREMEAISAMRLRNRLLTEMSTTLNDEFERLNELATLLPRESDLKVIEAPEIKDFVPGAVPSVGASRRISRPAMGFKLTVNPPETVLEEEGSHDIETYRSTQSLRVF